MRPVLALVLLAGLSSPALACDCIRLDPKDPHFATDLDRITDYYPVAAEGVVEADGPYAWRFRPTREYRGPGQESYAIELISDCSLAPQEMQAITGRPVFLLLAGGDGSHHGRYEASRCVNLLGGKADAAIRKRIMGGCHSR